MRFADALSPLRSSTVLAGVLVALMGPRASAQDLEPRSYLNVPVGLNFLIAGYAYSTGDVATDPSLQLENPELQSHSAILGYARALDVLGMSGKVDVILPYAWTSGSAELDGVPRERDVSGLGDPRFRFSVNFYGAPALSLEEFRSYQQDLIIGASLQVSAPLGQYDADKLLNNGTNRWSIKPELGISKALGPLTLELAAGVTFYTDNDDFYGGQSRTQDPLYSIQGHVIYTFQNGVWIGADGTYYTGGQSTIGGVERDDIQSNSRVGLTMALPVDRHNSVKFYASSGVSARTGGDFDAVGLAWQYRWGAGL